MGRRVALALTVKRVKSAKHPGGRVSAFRLHDGGGLYLQISSGGGKSWLLRYRFADGERLIGLGSTDDTSLAMARGRAAACRTKLQAGIDPLDERATVKAAAKVANLHTFKAVALDYIAAKRDGWSNPKHAAQWTSTLATYAFPTLGARRWP